MSNLQKKWNGLLHKVGYLKFEFEERTDKINKFESLFGERVSSVESTSVEANAESITIEVPDSSHVENTKFPEDLEIKTNKNDLEPFKKLWKQIALKTHPDVCGNDDFLIGLYKIALESWNKGEIEKLIDVASELQIKIADPTEEMISILENRISELEQQIKKQESSVIWAWGHADEKKQSLIVDEILKFRRNKKK